MADRYEPASFEAKWRQRWSEADLFKTREEADRPKFYGLDFFPYPSGAGLSVGHCRNYVPTDVICRMKYMQGHNVLHPMGFDAFGLPAENEAIKRKRHPREMTAEYTATYRRQMDLIGISYDWSRSFASCDPDFMKWTEWIFELLYKRGLAYRRLASVNWDPIDKTVLADEEIIGGRAERSGAVVEKKFIPQWFFRITEYAQRLIDDLDTIAWPEGIKTQQRNWIGRSEGVQFTMRAVYMDEAQVRALKAAASTSSSAPAPSSDSGRLPELEELEREVRASHAAADVPASVSQKIAQLEGNLAKAAEKVNVTVPGGDAFESARAKIMMAGGLRPAERMPSFDVFTTRVDTVFGMTFCVLAPEHPLVETLLSMVPEDKKKAIREYQVQAKTLSAADRLVVTREKTGVFSGAYAINPVNEDLIPIWIADYVLTDYGTGAIMAVPAHDERDFEFAVKFGLEVKPVIKPTEEYLRKFTPPGEEFDYERELARYVAYPKQYDPVFVSKDSVCFNSGWINGLTFPEATKKVGEWMEGQGIGARKIQYKLRDWLISRQRYWGCPIPVLHREDGSMELVPEDKLPVLLPDVDNYEPGEDGQSPLAGIDFWVNTTDSQGRPAKRETDTMGGFADSSWYFLRFCDPHNQKQGWDPAKAAYWMPVDCYVGGAEHAVMHLLYARFWTKVLHDEGLVTVKEPFQRLENQGQVLALTPYRKPREGEKLDMGEEGILISFDEAKQLPEDQVLWRWARMSKSKGNVVTPEEAVEEYGADALRIYLLFVAPFNADVQWDNHGMEGGARFLSRVYKVVEDNRSAFDPAWASKIGTMEPDEATRKLRRATHQAIRNSTEHIDRFAFNTYISGLMIFVNTINDLVKSTQVIDAFRLALSEALSSLVLLLGPAAPHSSDELWSSLGGEGFSLHAPWPSFDAALAVEDTVTIAFQVNGKLRDTLDMPAASSKEDMEQAALASAKVQAFVSGQTVKKVIVVPGRLVNVVVG
ncbi:MAG: leucyl-tRNA synthetase [Fimbriimonadaceae bacterium]|jgi:leucyl-tRNA synthetase|nr:leucyl-tRNA synthetase [Fimbriimonadaceae bacterium]